MGQLVKANANVVSDLNQEFELSDEAESCVLPEQTIVEALAALVDKEFYQDAVSLLAFTLPRREAVWWACLATKDDTSKLEEPDQQAALKAAEQWAIQPSEENRKIAAIFGDKLKRKTNAAWAATAAAWSAGNLTEGTEYNTPVPEHLYCPAVATAVVLSAELHSEKEIPSAYKQFLKQGLNLAQGGRGEL